MSAASLSSLGPEIPRSGGPLTALLGRSLLRVMGWRVQGDIPNVKKLVIIVAPHTSNWDFLVGLAAKFALRLRVLWLGKHTLFRFPLGVLMRSLGGMPVDRTSPNDVVSGVARQFATRDRLFVAIAPEGTRKAVARWRTGFYHIAHTAGVPILPVALNWDARAIQIGAQFETSGDVDHDLPEIQARFANAEGRRPKPVIN